MPYRQYQCLTCFTGNNITLHASQTETGMAAGGLKRPVYLVSNTQCSVTLASKSKHKNCRSKKCVGSWVISWSVTSVLFYSVLHWTELEYTDIGFTSLYITARHWRDWRAWVAWGTSYWPLSKMANSPKVTWLRLANSCPEQLREYTVYMSSHKLTSSNF